MLKEISTSCEYVSTKSKHVFIDINKLNELIKEMKGEKAEHWLASSPFGLLDLPIETIINFLLVYESINFCFWGNPKWTINTEYGDLDGSIALLYAILKFVKENNTTDFSTIQKDEFENILSGNIQIPLFSERLKIIRETSLIVNEKLGGNFYKYIKHITSDDELFELIISTFPSFKDERNYDGQNIYFYKLAQLLTSDILHIRQMKEHIDTDYSHLVGCADYKIPQILRAMGILVYDDELTNLIDQQQPLPIDSDYEVEIRANMIVVINIIYKQMQKKVDRIDINDFIYMKKNDKALILKPYHLTRCSNY